MLSAVGFFKKCGKCGIEKPASQFHSNKHSSLGLSWQCRSCHSEYVRQHYQKNRGKLKDSRKALYEAEKSQSQDGLRLCDRCCEKRPFSSFLTGKNWWCRECRREYSAKWRQENKETQKPEKKAWLDANRDRVNSVRKKYRDRNKIRGIEERLRLKYGLSLSEYNSMLERSGGLCSICKKPTEKLHVDHNHDTGQVRDLLCQKCNQGIGCFCEDPAILEAAITYVNKHNFQVVGGEK